MKKQVVLWGIKEDLERYIQDFKEEAGWMPSLFCTKKEAKEDLLDEDYAEDIRKFVVTFEIKK